jgi:hypothetical protein
MKLTHRTPHPPTLITAGIKDDEVLFDIFIGGKFKGVWRSIEWHYGSIKSRNTTQNAALALIMSAAHNPKCHGRLDNHHSLVK